MTEQDVNVRDAGREATELAGHDLVVHVLEPSPPAIDAEPWFADDPVAPRGAPAVLPDGIQRPNTISWSEWLLDKPDHGDWVTERWLGGDRRLPAATPGGLVETRIALHRLAAYVIAPTRHAANGKFGLRWTLGGFGTPFFGDNRQIRVEGDRLVDQRAGQVRSAPITTLRAAAEFLESEIDPDTAAEHDSPELGDIDETLAIDSDAAAFLGNWFGMAFAALESVRADASSVDPSRPQLWPGHFDPAIEIGDDDHRASYGASPGDDAIPRPYLYVSVWWPDRLSLNAEDEAWNAPSFTGSILELSDFPPGDPVATASTFFSSTRDRIHR